MALFDRSGLDVITEARRTPRRALTASATRVDLSDRSEAERLTKLRRPWQVEAWAYRRSIGEIRYAMSFLGWASSRMRLYPATYINPDEPPVALSDLFPAEVNPDKPPPAPPPGITPDVAAAGRDELARLANGRLSLGSILDPLAVNLETAGECYLVGEETDSGERWEIYSISELERIDQTAPSGARALYGIRSEPGAGGQTGVRPLDPATSYVARIWTRDPEWSALADSPMQAILSSCETLLIVDRAVRSAGRSRLSAGIMAVPDELAFAGADDTDEDPTDPTGDADTFLRDFTTAMVTPIQQEGAASAVVPQVVRGPKEALKELRHIEINRAVDSELLGRADTALRRIAQGLDVPPEIILGTADVNHWTAWQIDDNTFRNHVEPLVVRMVDALTVAVWRPALLARGVSPDVIARVFIWYDPAEIVTAPNRGKDAVIAHDHLVISDAALNRELGFSETDMPSEEEIAARVARKAAEKGHPETPGQATPGGPIDSGATVPPIVAAAPPQTARARRAARLSRRLSTVDRQLRDRIAAAADSAVQRALERAGARARSRAAGDPAIRASLVGVDTARIPAALGRTVIASLNVDDDELLAGAFDRLADQWESWTRDAQDRAIDTAVSLAGIRADDPGAARRIDALRAELDQGRADGWTDLLAALSTVAASRLYDPSPTAPPLGEHDPDVTVPTGPIRRALAIAGGALLAANSAGVDTNGRPLLDTDAPGQVATGVSVSDFLGDVGMSPETYEWVYGVSPRPFEPHAALDGVTVSDFTDPILANPGSFPDSAFLGPGDHSGCHCDLIPIYDGTRQIERPAFLVSGDAIDPDGFAGYGDPASGGGAANSPNPPPRSLGGPT